MTTFTNPTTPSTTGNNVSGKAGERIQWSSAVTIVSVTKSSSSTATHCYIQTAWGSGILATAAFSGDVATFNYAVSASTDYYILCDKQGSTYDAVYNNSASKPTADGIATWQAGVNQAGQESSKNYSRIILTIDANAASDVTVNPSTLTLSTSQKSPSYFTDIMAGTLALTSSALDPTTTIFNPVVVYPSSMGMTFSILDPVLNYARQIGRGTIGTQDISNRYPVTEGLTAETTRQTGQYRHPNLEPTERGTW